MHKSNSFWHHVSSHVRNAAGKHAFHNIIPKQIYAGDQKLKKELIFLPIIEQTTQHPTNIPLNPPFFTSPYHRDHASSLAAGSVGPDGL
jgi:hypothetical protein